MTENKKKRRALIPCVSATPPQAPGGPESDVPENLPEWPKEFTGLQRAFLTALAKGHSISGASRIVGMSRANAYRWIKSDKFREAYELAMEFGTQTLEYYALMRATDHDNPSDSVLMFLLRSRRPETYREQVALHHSGEVDHKKVIVLDAPMPDRQPDVIEA